MVATYGQVVTMESTSHENGLGKLVGRRDTSEQKDRDDSMGVLRTGAAADVRHKPGGSSGGTKVGNGVGTGGMSGVIGQDPS